MVFYDHFEEELLVAEKSMEDIKRMEIKTDEKCDLCGSPLLLKWGNSAASSRALRTTEGPFELHVHQREHGGQARFSTRLKHRRQGSRKSIARTAAA